MVYRYIKKVSTVISLLILLAILWSIFFLAFSRPSSQNNKLHGRYHVLDSHNSQSHPLISASSSPHDHTQQPISTSRIYSLLRSKDLNFEGTELLHCIKSDCRDSICSEFLTDADKPHFNYCAHKTRIVSHKQYRESLQSSCVFINGSHRNPVGLASYPGSGNTWVRGLLQEVTGLCTGGVYCDTELRRNGFPGESIRSGITFMVKSHQIDPRWEWVKYSPRDPFTYFKRVQDVPVYSAGVFILRNPFHAMVSEFKRQTWEEQPNNHIRTLGKEHFGSNPKWDKFVRTEALTWYRTVMGWLVDIMAMNKNTDDNQRALEKQHRALVVKYEDLLQDTKHELERILKFVGVPYSSKQLHAVVSSGYQEYQRRHDANFEHYTKTQEENVNRLLASLQVILKRSGYKSLNLTGYAI